MDGKDATTQPAPLRINIPKEITPLPDWINLEGKNNSFSKKISSKEGAYLYEQQLLTARQLARFRARNRLQQGLDIEEPEPGANRGECIRQVVEELSLSLMISGNRFPVVEAIREELGRQFGKKVEFYYPPGKKLRIFIEDNGKFRPLDENEQKFADHALDIITRQKVDETMLYKPDTAKHLPESQGE